MNPAKPVASLRRCLTATDLTLLGIGAIIGAGIFVLTGVAAATQAGPAIIISYIFAAVTSAFAALCYAELAATYSHCGGAYAYVYAGVGELCAWIIGWDLLLEYGMDASTVSIGWSGYLVNTLHAIGISLPNALTTDPLHGGIMNLPAVAIILGLSYVLSLGAKEGARFNSIIVLIKLMVIALFVVLGIMHFDIKNWHPFMPFGPQGIVNGASLIFFAYIGFDAIATAGEETINPQRNLPLAILASLTVCGIIYVLVAGILTGIAYYPTLNNSSPIAIALNHLGYRFASIIIAIGAIAGLTTTILAMIYGASRVFLAMARDGLFPKPLMHIHESSQTPRKLIWILSFIMAITAGFFPISDIASLVNIATLAVFIGVCGSVIYIRTKEPMLPRSFKLPFYPVIPVLGILLCLYLMSSLSLSTWIGFGIWTVIGLFIYITYRQLSRHKARQNPIAIFE